MNDLSSEGRGFVFSLDALFTFQYWREVRMTARYGELRGKVVLGRYFGEELFGLNYLLSDS